MRPQTNLASGVANGGSSDSGSTGSAFGYASLDPKESSMNKTVITGNVPPMAAEGFSSAVVGVTF